jgi:membrane protein YdbS with pleckstrin-like domain
METGPALRDPRERVSPRARNLWHLTSGLEGLVAGAVVVAALVVLTPVDLTWWLVVVTLAVVTSYAVVVPRWRYAVHRWEVTDTAVYTQVGWWSRERRIAPMSRIQTVDHAEGPLERLFGLARVTITTASAAGAVEIAGLDRDRARHLVEELTVKADAEPGDAT